MTRSNTPTPKIAVKTRQKRPYKHSNVTVAPTSLAYTLDQLRARHPIMALARMLGCGADTLDKIRDGVAIRNSALARIQARVDELLNPLSDPEIVDRALSVGTLACLVSEAKNPLVRMFLSTALRHMLDDGGLPPEVEASARQVLGARNAA